MTLQLVALIRKGKRKWMVSRYSYSTRCPKYLGNFEVDDVIFFTPNLYTATTFLRYFIPSLIQDGISLVLIIISSYSCRLTYGASRVHDQQRYNPKVLVLLYILFYGSEYRRFFSPVPCCHDILPKLD